jgi:hypothetical protein
MSRGLLKMEWKQSSIVLWAIFIVFFLQFPLRISLKLEEWKESLYEDRFQGSISYEIYDAFAGSFFAPILIGLVFILASLYMGRERGSKKHDFILSLPYSRESIFMTKWILGIVTILASFIINFGAGYFLINQSKFAFMLEELNLIETFTAPIAGYFVLFTFTMFIGTFTGNMRSQIVLSSILVVFPVVFFYLIHEFLRIHDIIDYIDPPDFIFKIFWPTYFMGRSIEVDMLLYPIIGGLIFFVLGLWIYKNAPAEYSGSFLMFPILRPIFKIGIIIFFALVGGLLMTVFIPYGLPLITNIIAYWIGAILVAIFAWIITTRTLGLKKVKWRMK